MHVVAWRRGSELGTEGAQQPLQYRRNHFRTWCLATMRALAAPSPWAPPLPHTHLHPALQPRLPQLVLPVLAGFLQLLLQRLQVQAQLADGLRGR